MALDLEHVAGNTYFIKAPVCVGLYVVSDTVILIDSGGDKEFGRQLNKLLEAKGWTLSTIINTHSHADHCGANAYLKQKTGCRILSTPIEKAFIEHPELEPSFLNGGFYLEKHRSKFLLAKPSHVNSTISGNSPIEDTGLRTVSLPGHTFAMVGIKTPDDVFFVADAVLSEHIVTKYQMTFLYDVKRQLETLAFLKQDTSTAHILSHGGLVTDFASLVNTNEEVIHNVLDMLVAKCAAKPQTTEDLLKSVFDESGLTMNETQYILNKSTLTSYLHYLCNVGRLSYEFVENRLFFRS
jgi:glyoxylase-like metal-dependent hydrolase (beta-lactamase superfamily II)